MLINKELLDEVSAKASASERLRMNFNIHNSLDAPAQRLLNALEPGTQIPIHRHAHTSETYVLLRGKLKLLLFDNNGQLQETVVLSHDGDSFGFDIPANQWHSMEVLESGTVILEVKDGPYKPLQEDDVLSVFNAVQGNHANRQIHLCLAHMSGNEQKYVQQAFSDNWVAPLGPNVDLFESMLEKWYGSNAHIAALASGTSAVHLGLLQLGVKPGDEVICQSFTFCASANPVVYCGATPIFVDSEPDTWNMSPQLLEEAIKDRIEKTGHAPKVIIPVHLYGMPAKMDEINAIAQKYGIPIMEDAAEALGSRYNGQLCGTFGKFGAMSFNGNKMITTSGGGALICNSEESKARTIFYATQSREPHAYYEHKEIGYNYRLSNICAGIGCGQMSVLDDHIAHHLHVHDLYMDLLSGIDGVSVHDNPDQRFNSNFWLTTILVDVEKSGASSTDINSKLNSIGIESRPLWKPMHLQPVNQNNPAYINGVSEHLFRQGLCLPSGPCVSDDDVAYIVEQIKKSLK